MPSLPNFGVYAIVDNADGYVKSMRSLEKANESAGDSAKDTAKSFGILDKAFDSTTAISVAAGNLISTAITGAFNLVVNAIGNVISSIGNLAKGIFDMGVQFSQTMANVSSITGLAGKDLQGLGKELIAIGADTAAGPQAIAEAYYDIASGVGEVSNQLPILNAAIATSEAGQSNLTATTNGLVAIMNAYSFSADQAAHVSDVFTLTVGKGVGTMDQFVHAMSPLAGLVATNKIKFDEFGASMAFLTMKGVPAEQAATMIKNAVTQLSRATPAATRAIKAMGEKSIEASIANHGFAETLGLLQQGAKKTGQNFTQMIGSVEALQAATALGTDEFQKFFDTFVDGVDGATAAARELQRADVSFQLKLINSRFQAIGLSIGQAVLPAFNKFLTFLNKSLAGFDWTTIGKGLDKLGEKLGESAGKLVESLGTMLSDIDWDQVAAGMSTALEQIGTWIANIDWQAVITGIQQFVENLFMIGSAVGSFIASIDWQAVIAGVQSFIGTLSTLAGQVIEFISGAIEQAQTFIVNWQAAWNQASGAVSLAFTTIQTVITGAIQPVIDAIQLGLDQINVIWNQVFGGTGSLSTNVSEGFISVQQFFTDALTPLLDAFRPLTDSLSSLWGEVFGAGGTVSMLFNDAMTTIGNMARDALEPITTPFSDITNGVLAIWNPIFGTSGSVSKPVTEALTAVKQAAENALNGIKAAFSAIGAAVKAALQPIVDIINSILAGIAALQAFAGGGGGSGGGGGGSARGGDLQQGLNIVGEHGREAIWMSGNAATVLTAQQTKNVLGGSMRIKGNHNAASAKLERSPSGLDFSSPSAIYELIKQYISIAPIPIQAGGGDSYNDNSSSSNMNINFNGVQNAESAMQRFALLRATGAY